MPTTTTNYSADDIVPLIVGPFNASMSIGGEVMEMEKTILLIALVVLGLCALEAVDLVFTMQLYSGLLP
jgi:hypothetical protein